MPRKKKGSGGKRPGAGRPFAPTERVTLALEYGVRAKMERFAKQHGIRKEIGKPYLGSIIKALVNSVKTEEAEWKKLVSAGNGTK